MNTSLFRFLSVSTPEKDTSFIAHRCGLLIVVVTKNDLIGNLLSLVLVLLQFRVSWEESAQRGAMICCAIWPIADTDVFVTVWFIYLKSFSPSLHYLHMETPCIENCVCMPTRGRNSDPSPPACFSSPCRQLQMIPWHLPLPNLPPPLPAPDNDGVVCSLTLDLQEALKPLSACHGDSARPCLFLKAHFPKGSQALGSVGYPCIAKALLEEGELRSAAGQCQSPWTWGAEHTVCPDRWQWHVCGEEPILKINRTQFEVGFSCVLLRLVIRSCSRTSELMRPVVTTLPFLYWRKYDI